MCEFKVKILEHAMGGYNAHGSFEEQAHLYSSAKSNYNQYHDIKAHYSNLRKYFDSVYQKVKNNDKLIKIKKPIIPALR